MKIYLILIFTCILCNFSHAQEYLSGLAENAVLVNQPSKASKTTVRLDTIKIPFLDDFSKNSVYPNPKLWADKDAFIDFTDRPYQISVGVATLDAWNYKGQVYEDASAFPFIADHLTSLPLDLSKDASNTPITINDGVYLSFYYQPSGSIGNPWELIGNAPEKDDSLIVEFSTNHPDTAYVLADTTYIYEKIDTLNNDTSLVKSDTLWYKNKVLILPYDSILVKADTTISQHWVKVWASEGMTLQNMLDNYKTYNRQIIIPINDAKYLYKGFQFRFANYASLYDNEQIGWKAGNIDQWYIDYVYLNKNRTATDTTYEDITFTRPQTSMLKKYTAIPWPHFNTINTTSLVKDTSKMYLKYLGINSVNSANVNFYVEDVFSSLPPFYSLFDLTTGRTINIPTNEISFFNTCSFDFKSSTTKDSATFKITNIMKNNLPFNQQNDTVSYYQNFFNYYAYDDGIPDNGYGIKGTNAYVASRFTSIKEDVLQGVQIFLNHTLKNENALPFKLCIWEDAGGFPGTLKYTQDVLTPIFKDSINQFYTYRITGSKFKLSGSYFIGWHQEKDIYLNIGFDKSENRQKEIFYKTGKDWVNTMYNGTLMMRPVFGKDLPQSINENLESNTTVEYSIYPNPVADILTIKSNQETNNVVFELYNTNGSKVLAGTLEETINMQAFSEGLYLLKITDNTGKSSMYKIIHTTR